MFSLWTGVFFHHCAPLSSWSDRTYPAAFSRSAARGESVGSRYPWREDYTKWRWGRQSDWCHPRVRGAVFYHLQCLRVKPQGAGHIPPEQDQGNVPVSFNTYRRCGSLRRKSHRGDSALQTSGIWELPDKILSALYFCVVFFFFPFSSSLPSVSCICSFPAMEGGKEDHWHRKDAWKGCANPSMSLSLKAGWSILLFILYWKDAEYRSRSQSSYTPWTKTICCSDKHSINDMIRKQGPLIIFSSALTLDRSLGPSRDFLWAKEIFTQVPVMGKGRRRQLKRSAYCCASPGRNS